MFLTEAPSRRREKRQAPPAEELLTQDADQKMTDPDQNLDLHSSEREEDVDRLLSSIRPVMLGDDRVFEAIRHAILQHAPPPFTGLTPLVPDQKEQPSVFKIIAQQHPVTGQYEKTGE